MHDDPLARLLQHADRAAGDAPPAAADLADRILHTQCTRQRNRRMAWAASFALGIVTVGWVFHSWLAGSTSTEHLAAERLIAVDAEAARLRAMSESLALEADWRAAVARRVATLRQLESRLDAFQQESAAPDPIAEAHRLIDQASLIMVTQADRMDREFGLTKSSARAFARAIELFPGALGATYARHRLKTLEHAIGDLL